MFEAFGQIKAHYIKICYTFGMKQTLHVSIIMLISIFLIGCTNTPNASEILQSNSATIISRDYKEIIKLLVKYKKILDLRNPKLNDKKLNREILFDMQNQKDTIQLLKNNSYKDYLLKAFDKNTKYKSDFLILGIYKMIFKIYNIKGGHHITALGYNTDDFTKAYYTLKVLRWKIRNAKDDQGRFIFATWQLNWQLELNKNYNNITIKNMKELPSLKNSKETLLSHSNFNFEITMSMMIEKISNSLKSMGEEPANLSISAMKAIILL